MYINGMTAGALLMIIRTESLDCERCDLPQRNRRVLKALAIGPLLLLCQLARGRTLRE